MKRRRTPLIDAPVPVRLKLSGLWAATMFCYVYGDYLGLWQPGMLRDLLSGHGGPTGTVTQEVLLGIGVLMAIPSLMVFLTLALPPTLNRWANIVCGALYTLVVLLTMPGSWAYYLLLSAIEMVLTALVVWHAWRWPRVDSAG